MTCPGCGLRGAYCPCWFHGRPQLEPASDELHFEVRITHPGRTHQAPLRAWLSVDPDDRVWHIWQDDYPNARRVLAELAATSCG